MGIKYNVSADFFRNWSPSMSYILGFIIADGSLEDASYLRGKYLRICSSDLEILDKIKKAMNSEHKIVVIKPRAFHLDGKSYISKEKYMIRIGSHEIYNDLINLGLMPNKSQVVRLPNIPREFLSYFVRGYLDGDGCINHYNKKDRLSVTFTSGSVLFLKDLANVISQAVGIKIHNVLENKRAYQIKYSTKEAILLLRYIYSDIKDNLYLNRKYKRFLDFMSAYPKWRDCVITDKSNKFSYGVVPKWLRELSAKQLCTGSTPVHAFSYCFSN